MVRAVNANTGKPVSASVHEEPSNPGYVIVSAEGYSSVSVPKDTDVVRLVPRMQML